MFSKMIERMFKKVDGVVYDLSTNAVGIKKDDSVFTLGKDEEGFYTLNENLIASFSQPVPAYAQSVPLQNVKVEDLILSSDGKPFGWVVKLTTKSLKVLKLNGTVSIVSPSKVGLLGQGQTVMVVASLINTSSGAMNPMMMAMMMEDDSESKDNILPMMLMMQNQNQDAGNAQNMMNPMMMMMMLMGDSKTESSKSDKMMKMMMMSQMMNGTQQCDQNNQMMNNPLFLAMMLGK